MKPMYKYARFVSPRYRSRRSVGGTVAAAIGSVAAMFVGIKMFPSLRRYVRMKRM
ncbi:MAG TPA: hypothetical protein VGD74_10105 [Vulgatibacter sp.]